MHNEGRISREGQSLLGPDKNNGAPIVIQRRSNEEGTPFLTDPVRLTPAWEASNLPNDELNFKGMTMERAQLEATPPHDKYNLVFLTLVLHGVGTLTSWNMFITAKSYFVDYKMSYAYTGEKSDYATNFIAYLGFASQVPNLLFNWLNIFVNLGGNLTTRIVWSILVEVVIFLMTVALAMGDSSDWPGAFFWITMITVVVLNIANGIYQNTVFGMAAKLPPKYTGAVVLGSNISGTFTAIISLLSGSMAGSVRTAAIYYFITAMFVLLACFDTYFALPLNRFYRYHELRNEQEAQLNSQNNRKVRTPFFKIFWQASVQLFNVFFIFFVTLAIFPAVHSDVKRVDPYFFVSAENFTVITCFITFNVCAMLGSLMSSWVRWPSPKYLVYVVVLRVLFIPLFLLCNYQPLDKIRTLPVVIDSDWAYWIIAVLMGVSSGHLSSLAMMYTPRTVEPQYAVTAGMFAAAMLITGIFTGILFSLVFPIVVSSISW